MNNCDHLFVVDELNKTTTPNCIYTKKRFFCIKCGKYTYYEDFSIEPYVENYDDEIIGDLLLLNSIYINLKKAKENISKELEIKYLKAALNNIRTKQKTENVIKKRIKRLNLYPGYSNWNKESVIKEKNICNN